ncbi:MAG: porin [Candidatus Handelsmanbacteria bacterium]|nr:porin [Candidatus Handelsmanbacteria bacterium]
MRYFEMLAGALLVGLVAMGAGAEEQRSAVPGGVLDKPYLKRGGKGTALGGYIDQELFWNDKSKTFTQHRFIPFLHGQVSERIHVMAELEFEYGGLVKGRGESDGEVKLEFATVDISFSEGLSYRAGLILSPLGRFNLQHDSPLNDLTNRPLVAREIIPTTLAETGMGFYGTFYPGDRSLLGYELYAVNGFNGTTATSIRNGRGSHKADNNEHKALVGRLNYSPMLGLDLGLSGHHGAYDDAGDHALTILALDADFNRGPLQLKGEYARASVEGAAADQQWGYYAQAAYHFLPGAVGIFPNSVFTGVFRYDAIDLETRDEKRYTLGMNFRPEEDTVLKLDYEVYDQDDQSNGLVFSVASYF